jgi:hypothetical protein
MDNLAIWEQVRKAPVNALKPIQGGKLRGKSDINPVWRMKAMTELFGACGDGWDYAIDKQWTEQGAKGEVMCFCNIILHYKQGAEIRHIQGTGGSMLVQLEKGQLVSNDEGYKMALTDALSVAMKALGVAADVYWEQDRTKYDATTSEDKPKTNDKPKEVLDSVIADSEYKGIINLAVSKHGEADGKECLKDYLTERGLKSLKELKKSKIADVSKYVAEWSDSKLPPDIA